MFSFWVFGLAWLGYGQPNDLGTEELEWELDWVGLDSLDTRHAGERDRTGQERTVSELTDGQGWTGEPPNVYS